MRRALLALVLVCAVAPAAPARADLAVNFQPGFGAVLTPEGTNGYRAIVEHFADGSRNGVRIRQISLGDPRIYHHLTSDCFTNPVANDVVCNGGTPLVQFDRQSSANDELVVGGSNTGCEPGPSVHVLLDVGAGDDVVRPRFACGGQENTSPDNRFAPEFDGLLGPGNDAFTGGPLRDRVIGESGNDTMLGGTGEDELVGDDGNDTIRGQGSSDTLLGGSGADVLDGGGQSDSLTYAVSSNVTITLDGVANDGRSNEHDNVTDVENITTGSGNDQLTGSSDVETFEGGGGNDVLNPGTGTDIVRGGIGADLIDVRESSVATRDVVSCGPGFDEVIADLSDSVPATPLVVSAKDDVCERVERFAVDDGPPGRIRGRSVSIGADGGLELRLSCPRRARVTCTGKLRVAEPGRPGRALAQARYSVPRRATAEVGLSLSRAEARRARARGSITAITRERGVSKKGPRGTITTLSVSRRRG